MHPLISLLSFIVFALFVSLGEINSSITGTLLLMLTWFLSRELPPSSAWRMVRRLRIFFISIFIMYLWFTPGQLMIPAMDTWSPTYDGLFQGGQRVLALIILVLGVESLLRLTSREELLSGLYYLATPFQWFGVDRQKFIVRVLLTLEMVSKQGPLVNQDKIKLRNFRQYLTRVSDYLADHFNAVNGESVDAQPMTVEIKALPGWLQWLIPISMVVLFQISSGIKLQ